MLRERTFLMIKPEGFRRGFVGNLITRFELKGFKMVATKLLQPGKATFE